MSLPSEIVGQSCMFYGAGVGLRRFSVLEGFYGSRIWHFAGYRIVDGIGAASPMELSRIGNTGGLRRSPANGSAVHG